MLETTFPLPQNWIEESAKANLEDAVVEAFGSRPWQDRDWPGNVQRGVSPMDKNNFRTAHPVPDYGDAPRHVLSYEQGMVGREDVEVVQITPTVMPPAAAKAYIKALWADPHMPFVTAHTFPSVELNGSVGYFTVGGPALAVPLHHPPAPEKARRRPGGRGNFAAMPEPVDLTTLTPLPVSVSNDDGIDDSDFIWAARNHPSLGLNDILTGSLRLRDVDWTECLPSGEISAGGEAFKIKVAGPSGVIGYFDDTASARDALEDAIHSRKHEDTDYLEDFTPLKRFTDEYSIVPCLVKDGKEVTKTLTTRLATATATVYGDVATVTPGAGLPITGWMMAWQTADWHRNNIWVDRNPGPTGPMLRRRDHWR